MKVISRHLSATLDNLTKSVTINPDVDLVIVHGNPFSLEEPLLLDTFAKTFPNACVAGCSSDGVFFNGQSYENSVIYTAINFDNTEVRQARIKLVEDDYNEYASGKMLADQLIRDDLISVIIFSEGTKLDCHLLLEGVREVLGSSVAIWGGLASDKTGFDYTVVIDSEDVYDDAVVAVGLYGNNLVVDTALSSQEKTGVEIDITRAEDNIIHEINGQPAAKVFKSIIHDHYDASMSLMNRFPIIILDPQTRKPMYSRVIYHEDKEYNSIYSVASVNEGPAYLVCMTETKDNLADAAETCASLKTDTAEFVLVASCAGRKAAMNTDWINESALIQQSIGGVPSFGFYAYGEIGKNLKDNPSLLHNHTLSMITLYET